MSRFTCMLVFAPLPDGKTWATVQPFGYDGGGVRIKLEIGFQTDFASIPRISWIFLPKWGKYGQDHLVR